MSSNQRGESLSPDQTHRISKSRSSSRSQRSSPKRPKTSTSSSHRISGETNERKRAKSSSNNGSSPEKSKPSRKKSKNRSKDNQSTANLSDFEGKIENTKERQDLTARGLSKVPEEIFHLSTLRYLNLSNNNLSGLPSEIRFLTNLEHLDLSRNPLRVKNGLDDYECLPKEFSILRKLRTLILSECSIKHIPAIVWKATSLRNLDLSRNKVGYIVGEIGNLIDLRYIRFSQMNLDTLPAEIGFCERLKTIDLTGNPIDNLPETLVECRRLYELKIDFHTFHQRLDQYLLDLIEEGKIRSEHLPTVIFELESLLFLDLSGTYINQIPSQHSLINLNQLDLSSNSFQQIPNGILTMNRLKLLNMSNNKLEKIDEFLIEMKELEILILSGNRFKVLSAYLGKIKTLKQLNLSRNQIKTIDEQFTENRTLISLDLSSNKLETLPEYFCRLEQLETLDLRHNQLESLPLSMGRLKNLKSMNSFDENFHRIGLHLLGNELSAIPSHVWKTTAIESLYDFIGKKEKELFKDYFHLKLIFIGPKTSGKTSLLMKLVNNRYLVSAKRETFDLYVSLVRENCQESPLIETKSETASSIFTDHWIENQFSVSGETPMNRIAKIKRLHPPPLRTYQGQNLSEYLMNQSTLITRNNLYCSILDLKTEQTFEILYPSIFDSQALFIITVNLSNLLKIIENAKTLDDLQSHDESSINILDYGKLLTSQWFEHHIFRFIQMISDHCQQASIAVIGLLMKNENLYLDDQAEQILDEIHLKINENRIRWQNIRIDSEYFPRPIYLDDEQMSSEFLRTLETIGQNYNFRHEKTKRIQLKQRLGFDRTESWLIDYRTALESFQEISTNSDDFDQSLDYLKLTGDLICSGEKPNSILIIKPYHVFNRILSRTIFHPHLNEWLNYQENSLFHFSGFYPTEQHFNLDRQRLLNRGEFTWKMLKVIFADQIDQSDRYLIDCCRLIEDLCLGFVQQSNLDYHEFTTMTLVCPWFLTETTKTLNQQTYFTLLEQQRAYEQLRLEYVRRFKQEQLWFATDSRQGYIAHHMSEGGDSREYSSDERPSWTDDELPAIETMKISSSQLFYQGKFEKLHVSTHDSSPFPPGLYQRLLICLHPLFLERLDFANVTLGRSIDKHLIRIDKDENENSFTILTDDQLSETIETYLIEKLFYFYPSLNFQIKHSNDV